MTEIPEHLLKRSKAARAQAEGGAPRRAPRLHLLRPRPEPRRPRPLRPRPRRRRRLHRRRLLQVRRHRSPTSLSSLPPRRRKKIPFWAFATLSTLPLWAFMYVRALTPSADKIAGPLGDGAQVYTGCSSCHGSQGEGGVGYQFSKGEVLKTFPHIEDQLRWVYNGTDAYATAGIEIYGDPNRAGGAHVTKAKGVMPAQGGQSDRSADPGRRVSRAVHVGRRRSDRRERDRVQQLVRRGFARVGRVWKTAPPRSTTSTPRFPARSRSAPNLRQARPPAPE